MLNTRTTASTSGSSSCASPETSISRLYVSCGSSVASPERRREEEEEGSAFFAAGFLRERERAGGVSAAAASARAGSMLAKMQGAMSWWGE